MSVNSKDVLISQQLLNANINKKDWGNVLYNVKVYGAEGDGVKNDTAAILKTIQAAHSGGGGTVFFPPGKYLYTGSEGGNFILLPSRVSLRGSGKEATALLLGSVGGLSNAGIYTEQGSEDCGIYDLTLDGNNRGTWLQAAIMISPNSKRTIVRDVLIQNHKVSLSHIHLYDCTQALIDNVVIEGSNTSWEHLFRIASDTNGSPGYNTVSNCTGRNGGFGFSVIRSSKNNFVNCQAYADNSNSSLEGFNCDGGEFNNFVNCKAISRGDGGYIETDDQGLGHRPKGNRVSGFTAIGNKYVGFGIDGSDGTYSDIICVNNGQGGASVLQTYGIYVSDNAKRNTINNIISYDDQITKTQTHGLLIDGGAQNIYYSNVQGYGNAVALIEDRVLIKSGRIKFHAHNNGVNTLIASSAAMPLPTSTVEYNSGNCYSTSTKRFTPTKAGVYHLHMMVNLQSATDGMAMIAEIRKNGSTFKWFIGRASGTANQSFEVSAIVYANGTTDYFEACVTQDSGGNINIAGDSRNSYFEGFLLDN